MTDDGWQLAGLLADWSAQEAGARRSRQRWLTAQAEGSATLVGSLVDLAERASVVLLSTAAGTLTGTVTGVGRDFCVLEAEGSPPLLVATAAVSAVSAAPDDGPPAPIGQGDRGAVLDLDLASAVAALGADRQRVRAHLAGGSALNGVVRSVGEDVLTLAGDGRETLVALRAVVAMGPG